MTSPLPFVEFHREIADLGNEVRFAIDRVLTRGRFILGAEVSAFEEELAQWLGRKHVVSCANGTDAVTLAILALELEPGSEVLMPANTCMPTAVGIRRAGAMPVPVDVDPHTLQMSAATAKKSITSRTRAIVPVHLFGNPADIDELRELGLPILEDCAQAQGAMLRERMVGTLGTLASFSFYPTKNLGAYGDGGAVATDDPELAARMRSARQYGYDASGISEREGMNSRLDELQAAILRVKLRRVHAWNERRRAIAERYRAQLASVQIPELTSGGESSRHLFPVLADRREELRAHLDGEGIGTLIHYPVPVHLHPVFRKWGLAEIQLPVAEDAARRVVSLPMGPYLRDEEVTRVTESIERFYRG